MMCSFCKKKNCDLLQVQSGISPSSVLSSHLEPPSNQSSHRNYYAPQWTEEDKVPFALPIHSLSCPNQNPI